MKVDREKQRQERKLERNSEKVRDEGETEEKERIEEMN